MWPFSFTTPEVNIPDSHEGTSTFRLIVILGGASLILFGSAYLLNSLYPFFDDLHESKSEADSNDSKSNDSDSHDPINRDFDIELDRIDENDDNDEINNNDDLDVVGQKIMRDLEDRDVDKNKLQPTLFGF